MWSSAIIRSRTAILAALFLFVQGMAPADPPAGRDIDSDGDGLADYHELHKYHSDPTKNDTSGTGTPDGGLAQRREFTYSVHAVIRVMPPYNLKAATDDYQDVRVISETPGYAEFEVVSYPLNTNAAAIRANPSWRKDGAGMQEFLAPGVTTNWDKAMRSDLLAELARDGIDRDKLADVELVERVSRWLFSGSSHRPMFCTNFVHFPDGKPAVFPGLERAFQREKGDPTWSVEEQFARELFGKQMFYR
jgi:hypothetical protein